MQFVPLVTRLVDACPRLPLAIATTSIGSDLIA